MRLEDWTIHVFDDIRLKRGDSTETKQTPKGFYGFYGV